MAYFLTINQKISSIRGIKREEAMQFVDQVLIYSLLVVHSIFIAELFILFCRRPKLSDPCNIYSASLLCSSQTAVALYTTSHSVLLPFFSYDFHPLYDYY